MTGASRREKGKQISDISVLGFSRVATYAMNLYIRRGLLE